jgi:hypothetical protein
MPSLLLKDALTPFQVVAAIGFGLALVVAIVQKVANSRRSLPPGPPGNLVFGNSWPQALCVVSHGSLFRN